jgi:ABC-type uncharacterized transport system permease subunit
MSNDIPAPADSRARGAGTLRAAWNVMLMPALAILVALVIGALVIQLAGANPLLAYYGLLVGAFGGPKEISETIVWTVPYIFAGLAVALGFKGGLFNIGAEGQLAFGAVASAWIGYALPGVLGVEIPAFIHIPLTVLGGCLAGAVWGGIPGWLKARTGGHEVINTIMMNYLALLLTSYLLNGPMKDPNPLNVIARTPSIALSARIPPIFADYRVHWGIVIGVAVAVLIWWLLYRTTFGFEVRTVGLNPDAARYAGIKVGRIIVATMALSGGLAGLAGAVEVTALNFRHELSFSLGYGFDAITVALLGRSHPLGVVAAAFLMGAMRSGATRMQFESQVPVDIISVIQALILMFVAADQIVRYIFRLRTPREKLVLTRGWGS